MPETFVPPPDIPCKLLMLQVHLFCKPLIIGSKLLFKRNVQLIGQSCCGESLVDKNQQSDVEKEYHKVACENIN